MLEAGTGWGSDSTRVCRRPEEAMGYRKASICITLSDYVYVSAGTISIIIARVNIVRFTIISSSPRPSPFPRIRPTTRDTTLPLRALSRSSHPAGQIEIARRPASSHSTRSAPSTTTTTGRCLESAVHAS